VGSSAWNLSG